MREEMINVVLPKDPEPPQAGKHIVFIGYDGNVYMWYWESKTLYLDQGFQVRSVWVRKWVRVLVGNDLTDWIQYNLDL